MVIAQFVFLGLLDLLVYVVRWVKIIYHLFNFLCGAAIGGCNGSPGGIILPF